ncbi:DUF6350 family protein [Rothia sp. LK2588]|uniref:cell division protein PerM n=1 Tax=Rothia sp. LK2588 TaxID=3114369 RepID=UPI0034CEADEB
MKTTTKNPASRPAMRGLPMPLWMQGALELALAAAFSLVAVAVLLLAVWGANGFDNRDAFSVVTLSGQIWQLIHGVPLHLQIPNHGQFAAISGTMSLIPLGLTLIPLGLCFRSGRRLAQASYEGQFWVPTLAGALAYSVFSVLVSLLLPGVYSITNPVLAAIIPLWVVLLGVIGGGWYESRSLARMIGVDAATWVAGFSQYSRWAGSYAWAVIRSAVVAFVALIGLGALLAAVSIFVHWGNIVALFQQLHAGAIGDTAVTLLQLGYIPNLVVWAMALSTGAGFSFGEGTSANLGGTNLGMLPSLPVLGAIPHLAAPWSLLLLLAPVLAGMLAGWWFFRAGENHFDDWVSLKLKFRPLSWLLSTLGLAVLIGLLTGLFTAALGWFAHGSLGLGRFTDIGPHPLFFALMTAATVALGVVLGSALAPLLEKNDSDELERFAESSRGSRRAEKKQRRAEAKAARRTGRRKTGERAEEVFVPEEDEPSAERDLANQDASGQAVAVKGGAARNVPAQTAAEDTAPGSAKVIPLGIPAEPAPAEPQPTEPQPTAQNRDQDAPAASESAEPVREDDPVKPKLSRGRVIKRPKSRRPRD